MIKAVVGTFILLINFVHIVTEPLQAGHLLSGYGMNTHNQFVGDVRQDIQTIALKNPFKTTINIANATLHITIKNSRVQSRPFDLSHQDILTWIKYSAATILTYYGTFPTSSPQIIITLVSGRGVKSGRAFPVRGGVVLISVGRSTRPRDLRLDWIMVHEMIHLSLPHLSSNHSWMHEGLAVYVESIARVQAGHLTERQIWSDFIKAMPQGLLPDENKGLDHSPGWGATYWGGALFYLLADIEIRKKTNNRFGLQQALQQINRKGGDYMVSWTPEKIFSVADEVSGQSILQTLYHHYGQQNFKVNLAALWASLGVSRQGGEVRFIEDAPLAHIRRGIFINTNHLANTTNQ